MSQFLVYRSVICPRFVVREMFTRVFERLSGDVSVFLSPIKLGMYRMERSLEVVNNFETTPFGQTVSCAFDSQRHNSFSGPHPLIVLQISFEYLNKR
jgi:hypothetical protein